MAPLLDTALFEILVGASLGYIANLTIHKISEIRAEDTRRIDDLCDRIMELSDISTDYFLRDASSELDIQTEVRVIGKTFWVQSAIAELTDKYHYSNNSMEKEILDFMDVVSGKNFQSIDRKIDINQAVDVQITAGKLIFAIRGPRRRKIF